MEASALPQTATSPQALLGRSPLLRLQSDEKLIALTRRANPAAFDALVHRYQARLLSFLRHMLGSTEDAEDVLQEVFASAFNAVRADDRPINARPWLYRIARNRALNHLRRPAAAGQDTMDVFERAAGETTAEAVHRREDFRLLIADVQELPESQRTALLMREIDALSYEQIAEAMETTVPSVKSLLVRARVGLAEAAEARSLSCAEVRLVLAEAEEGIAKLPAPVRRHVKGCDRCHAFRDELRRTTKALSALLPVGPLAALHALVWGKLGASSGGGAGAGTGGSGMAGGSTVAGGSAWGGGTAASGSAVSGFVGGEISTGGILSTGVGALATKAAAGLVAAAVVTAGAVEVVRLTDESRRSGAAPAPAASGKHDAVASTPMAGGGAAPFGWPAASPAGSTQGLGAPAAAAEQPEPAGGDSVDASGGPAPAGDSQTAAPPATDTGTDTTVAPDVSVSDDGGVSMPPVDSGDGSSSGVGTSPGDGSVSGSEGGGSGSSGGDGGSVPPSGPPGDPSGSSPGQPGPPPVVGEPGV